MERLTLCSVMAQLVTNVELVNGAGIPAGGAVYLDIPRKGGS